MKSKNLFVGVAMLCAAVSDPAFAHHSTAGYDALHPITVSGTVQKFYWTNPHMFIDFVVHGADGHDTTWSVECGTPAINSRKGWRPDSVKSGDKLTIRMLPSRFGATQGQATVLTFPNGKVLLAPGHDVEAVIPPKSR